MKISTLFSDRLKSLGLVILLTAAVGTTQAATHYVRMEGDATSWGSFAGADVVTSNTPVIIPTDTYYFAKGTYTLTAIAIDPVTQTPGPTTPALTTGVIYGGFSGSEATIDLTKRALSDKDGNGIVEPWEFTNETILKGSVPFSDLQGGSLRLLTVTGGEVNGVTFFDHFYYGQTTTPAAPYSGAIILGVVSSSPGADTDIPDNAGKLRYCTVRRLKAGANGPVMITNSKSLVDHCLIEECMSVGGGTNGGGGAIWMYPFGGTVSNSVIRNNAAVLTAGGSGRGGAIYSAYNTSLTIPNYAIIKNCAIYNNTSGNSGGAMRLEGKNGATLNLLGGQVINCTIANNATTGSGGIASVELIFDGQLMVNTVVVGDPKDEVRPQANNNYYSNCVYGSKNGSIVMLPGTDLTTGKVTADLKFKKVALSYSGAMFPGDLTFVQSVYDSIRSTNLTIIDPASPAVTTPGLTTMPAAFTSNSAIIPTATIPATDLAGVARIGNYTIGAYQYVPVSGVNQIYSDKVLNVIALQNSILINDQEGKVAIVYSASGQLLKKVSLKSNNEIVPLSRGFYVVSVNNRVGKVVVK